jgi:RNA polymerase sigma-70 factor, ECF subfamily
MQHFSQNLIAGFNDRNEKAVASMCMSYYPVIEYKVKKFTGGSPDDADLIREVITRFLEGRAEYYTIKNLEKYLNDVIKGVCEDERRKKETRKLNGHRVRELLIGVNEQNMENAKKRRICDYLARLAVENLPSRSRQVFLMSYIDEMTSREIAADLNLSPRTVEFHKNDAYKRLRLEIYKREGDLGGMLMFLISFPLWIAYLFIQKLFL